MSQPSESRNAQENSMSIDDTNKLRISLGLAPLTLGPDLNSEEAVAKSNYEAHIKSQRDAAKETAIRAQLDRAKAKRKASAITEGVDASLGSRDAGAADDDNLRWVKRQRRKAEAERKNRQLDEMDDELQQMSRASYKSEDLSGFKVRHSVKDLAGPETILVLRDQDILHDDGHDELVNPNLLEYEKSRKNINNKASRSRYDLVDDGLSGNGMLAHHEDTETSFTLDSKGGVTLDQGSNKDDGGANVSTLTRIFEIKDYYTKEEVTFRKSKSKKKAKKRSVRRPSDDAEAATSVVQAGEEFEHSNVQTDTRGANFVDDDDLQQAIEKARRARLAAETTEEPAAAIASLVAGNTDESVDVEDEKGLVLDDTKEFVRTLGVQPARSSKKEEQTGDEEGDKVSITKQTPAKATSISTPKWKLEVGKESSSKPEDFDTTAVNEVEVTPDGDKGTGLESEPLLSQGLGSTLLLLKKRGILETRTAEARESERLQLKKEEWLRESSRQVARDSSSKGSKRDSAKRERERIRELEERFKDYKPIINLQYSDEFGRPVGQKEAFQLMSHKFHGKKPGKMKTEKRLKKLEEERRLNSMSSTDTPYGLAGGLLQKQKESGEAHVLLSVGNRGSSSANTRSAPGRTSGKG